MRVWKTISARVDETTHNAIRIACEREHIKPNKYLAKIIEREVAPILDPSVAAQRLGFPQTGKNVISYLPDVDLFRWELVRGSNLNTVLAEQIQVSFLADLKEAIDKVLELRKNARLKITRKQVPIPRDLAKWEVKHAGH